MISYDRSVGEGYTILTVTKESGFKIACKDIKDNDLIFDEIELSDENNNADFYSREDDLSQFQEEFNEYLKKFKQD